MIETIIGIIGIILTIRVPFFGFIYNRRKKLKQFYKIIWRPRIMLIDNLHRFIEQQNFAHLFRLGLQ